MQAFAGPSDKGVYSASVQQTLYDMGKAVIEKEPLLDQIVLEMPNIHNIPFPLENYGLKNKDHSGSPTIFFPIDEPHGMIKVCTLIAYKCKTKLQSCNCFYEFILNKFQKNITIMYIDCLIIYVCRF